MDDMILEIRHLSKSFGSHEVLRDIDFTVKKGDVTSIIGASGSGKSTLLRCINLLETPTSGEILYRGQNVTGPKVNAPQYRSHVGMVFQSFNLISRLDRFVRIAQMMGECTDGLSERAAAELAISAIKTLSKDVGIPTTITELAARYVKAIDPRDIPAMVGHAQKDTCAATNPRTMSLEIISQLYKDVF